MTDRERYAYREQTIALLEKITPELEPINRGAAESSYRMARRLREQNDRLAQRIAREATQ